MLYSDLDISLGHFAHRKPKKPGASPRCLYAVGWFCCHYCLSLSHLTLVSGIADVHLIAQMVSLATELLSKNHPLQTILTSDVR